MRALVINGLTDYSHPCQALADLFTREIFGEIAGRRLAFVGDATQPRKGPAEACGRLGMEFAIAAPPGYQFEACYLEELKRDLPQLKFQQTTAPREAVRGACCVYTDVWASMGQEAEKNSPSESIRRFSGEFCPNETRPQRCSICTAYPLIGGEEVSAEVIDGPQSAVIPEAANRMHVQKGLMAWLGWVTTPLNQVVLKVHCCQTRKRQTELIPFSAMFTADNSVVTDDCGRTCVMVFLGRIGLPESRPLACHDRQTTLEYVV